MMVVVLIEVGVAVVMIMVVLLVVALNTRPVLSRSHGLPTLSLVWQHLKLSYVSLGARPRYSLVVDEDVKKPTKQTKSCRVKCIKITYPVT